MGTPLILIVLVDALGWEVAERGAGAPWLGDLLPHRRAIETVLGFSAGAIPTLLSGARPQEHGRWLMFSRARNGGALEPARAFARLPARLRRSYRVSRLLHDLVARRVRGYFALYEVPWHLLPHFDLSERVPLYAPGGLAGQTTWFDDWRARSYAVRAWDWRTPEEENADAFVAAAGERGVPAADVLFWYTPGQDARQHRHGTRHREVEAHLEWLGARVREAARRAGGAGREPWIYVLSDHGMTDVRRTLDPFEVFRVAREEADPERRLVEARDWLAFYDSTLARFWWESEDGRRRLRPGVRRVFESTGAGRWLTDDELAGLGCRFEDRRYGEDVFLLEPGALWSPSYMSSEPVAGMHGYHPEEPTSRAVILANRPLPETLRHVADVAGHLERECEERDACPAKS